jgi:hypothetical protein
MKKVIVISTLVVALIVLGGISPSICSKDIEPIKISQEVETVTVEVNKYYDNHETIFTELTLEEIKQLEIVLTRLDEAIENSDEKTIQECEEILNGKGLFGNGYEEFYSKDTISEKLKSSRLSKYARHLGQNGDDLSNLMCYFHATGQGMFFFWVELSILESILNVMQNASTLIELLVLFIALMPFYAIGMLMTHIVPFRILMPKGVCRLDAGRVTSIGLKGHKKAIPDNNESIMLNVSGFTGITISWPAENNSFLFVSGIAVRVTESFPDE